MICVFVVADVKEVSWPDLEALPKMVIFPAKRRQGMLVRFLALALYEHLVLTSTETPDIVSNDMKVLLEAACN